MIKITKIIINSTELFAIPKKEESLKKFLVQSIEKFSETLNLTTLESLVVTGDFFGDVLKYQSDNGLQTIGATKTTHEIAIAKVLKHRDGNGQLKQTVFFSDYIADLLFTDKSNFAYHTLHHELCHVHENYYSEQIYSEEGKRGDKVCQLTHILNIHADMIWSEYYVERLSFLTLDHDNISTISNHLIKLLERTDKEITEKILRYRTDEEVNDLFREVQEKSSLLLKVAGTLLGILHGLREYSSDLWEKVYTLIETSIIEKYKYFLECWRLLDAVLENLYRKYPDWNDVYELDELGQVVLDFWKQLGMHPENTDEGLFIGIVR